MLQLKKWKMSKIDFPRFGGLFKNGHISTMLKFQTLIFWEISCLFNSFMYQENPISLQTCAYWDDLILAVSKIFYSKRFKESLGKVRKRTAFVKVQDTFPKFKNHLEFLISSLRLFWSLMTSNNKVLLKALVSQ